MNIQTQRPSGHQPWEQVRTRLDQNVPFSNMHDTPYYRDAVYDQFSKQEYARRYRALRDKMREHKLDCVIVPGGPSHWSFGGGMQWLTGHWEWHAISSYVVVPLEGEPTLIFSMGGTHAEAVPAGMRQRVDRRPAQPQRPIRRGHGGAPQGAQARARAHRPRSRSTRGTTTICRSTSTTSCARACRMRSSSSPRASCTSWSWCTARRSCDCVRKAGMLCQRAMEAMVARAKPGMPEYELRAAAGAAILDGGGDIDFLIIGTTPMDDPAMVFGNPRPSHRKLQKGDIVNMELAAGYNGLSAQIGSPITLGPPTDMVRKFWDEITLPGYEKIIAEIKPGNATDNMRLASRFFRDKGVQSRPTQVHGIDIVTDKPHVFCRAHRSGRDRQGAQARHDHHGRAQPDHRGRHVRHLPRAHLHRDQGGA